MKTEIGVSERIERLEIIFEKEIRIYKILLAYETKKMNAILENRIQDLDMYLEFQAKQMEEASKLNELKEAQIEKITMRLFPHMMGNTTIKDIINRLPLTDTIKLVSLRLELNALLYKLKNMNKLIPRLLEQAMEIFMKSRDVLSSSKRIGYNSRGKQESVKHRMKMLLNKCV